MSRESPPAREPLVVRTLPAERASHYEVRRSYVGSIQPRRRSEVGFELAGRLTRLHADDGDTVARGERLAALDTDRLKSRRAELVARRREAQARADLASIIHRRLSETFEANAATPRELDEARQEMEATRAVVERVERQIDSVEVDLEKSVLRAPFDAVIAERRVDEGRVVDAGTVVIVLLERTRPEARIGIPPGTAASLDAGDALDVRVNGSTHSGSVHRLLPVTDRSTQTVEVVLRLDTEFDGLRDGDLARTVIPRRIEREGYWLPLSALTESARGLWACYVAEPVEDTSGSAGTHRVSRRQLEIIHTRESRAFVIGTLEPGEAVVADGLHRLVAGQGVRLGSNVDRGERGEP